MRVEIEGQPPIEFPDGADPAVIDAVVKRDFVRPSYEPGSVALNIISRIKSGGLTEPPPDENAPALMNAAPTGIPQELKDRISADIEAGARPRDIVYSIMQGKKYPKLAAKMSADLGSGMSYEDIFDKLSRSSVIPTYTPGTLPVEIMSRDASGPAPNRPEESKRESAFDIIQRMKGTPVGPGMPTSVEEVKPQGLNERGQTLLTPETIYKGIPEAAANTATGIVAFTAGGVNQFLYTLRRIVEGSPDPVGDGKKAGEWLAQKLTYEPTSKSGQEISGTIGGLMNAPFIAIDEAMGAANIPENIRQAVNEGIKVGLGASVALRPVAAKIAKTRFGVPQETPFVSAPSPGEEAAGHPETLPPSEKAVEISQRPEVNAEAETLTSGELRPGDSFTRLGEKFKVEDVSPLGTVTIKDGATFKVREDETILADKGSVKLAPLKTEAIPPESESAREIMPPSASQTGSFAAHPAESKPTQMQEASRPEGRPLEVEQPQGDIAAGGLAFGQELPKFAAGNTSINLERIDADYPVKYLINQVAEQFKGKIDNARRSEITLEQTRRLADDLGMTEQELLSRHKGQAFNAEEATAARDILNTSAKNLVELQKKAVESGADADLVNFRLALSRHAAIQAEVSGVATEAGRALSAHRILSKSISQTSRNQKAMLDALGGREITEDIARALSQVDANNIAEVNRFIRAFSKVKKSDMIYEAWINFLLSGPKTHVVNTVSNTLTFLTKSPETALASAVDIIRAKMGKSPRERFLGEAAADFVGARSGLIDGVRAALRAFREEMPDDALLKLEQAKYKAIPGKVGEVVRLPGRFLTAADEFYKSVNYASELYALAYRKAAKEGLSGKALIEKAVEFVQEPTPDMVEAAKHEAQYRTFTQPYGRWGRIIERARQIPGVRYIVPFMRTPTNIAKFALERTPMNFARILYKAKQGEIKGSQLSDELAKPILGSMIGAAVVALAQAGAVTGGGPKNSTERAALYRAGWQPYSLKIGDKYYSYGRLEPVGSVFGMAADYVEMMKDTEDKEAVDYAENIALSISKNLTSKTFMKGMSSALDAVSDPRRYGESWIEGFAGSVVPSVVNTAAKMADENVREVHGPAEAMKARIPYLSKDLPPRRDLWGREIKYSGNAFERGFSPVSISEDSNDPVDKELQRLGITPGMPSRTIKGIRLTPVQYDIYAHLAGQEAYKNVSKIVNRDDAFSIILSKDDTKKAKFIKSAIEDARRDIAKAMYRAIQKDEDAPQLLADIKAGEKQRDALRNYRNFNRVRRAFSIIKAGRLPGSEEE